MKPALIIGLLVTRRSRRGDWTVKGKPCECWRRASGQIVERFIALAGGREAQFVWILTAADRDPKVEPATTFLDRGVPVLPPVTHCVTIRMRVERAHEFKGCEPVCECTQLRVRWSGLSKESRESEHCERPDGTRVHRLHSGRRPRRASGTTSLPATKLIDVEVQSPASASSMHGGKQAIKCRSWAGDSVYFISHSHANKKKPPETDCAGHARDYSL
jgi:hypothetical protein